MSVRFGENIKVDIYGASHAEKIGVTIEGMPKGVKIDAEELQQFLNRRAPGQNAWSTPRKEADRPEFISGVDKDLVTNGETLEACIFNTNIRPQDYGNVISVPRPGHADYTSFVKYGKIETGGGKWSGRLTAPICIAGGIFRQMLSEMGIEIKAHIYRLGDVVDEPLGDINKEFPVVSREKGEQMMALIAEAKEREDSIGGEVECVVYGMPAGIGDALFGGIESRISQAMFGVPAVKAIEFGTTKTYGSENNDAFDIEDGEVVTKTNNHGGILGGISSGMPIVFRVKFKPTPSIGIEQDSVDLLKMEPAKLVVNGRHDPCIVPRAVPVVEAACAIAIFDLLMDE